MAEHIELPEGWTVHDDYVGWRAVHDNFDADFVDGQFEGNGLSCWAMTEAELPALVAEIEAEHPHFADTLDDPREAVEREQRRAIIAAERRLA